ncbi:MAG: hypothetical protein SOY60_05940 [Fusobacterium gastrosuis]|uniref:hypothetical protein n=1 Tax=Fusobacterium gastrosuis TaxID=1755100 RepID=UPI002A8D03C8|nr:hypothetical protein [Fusobacterium gastrosuis]
MKEHCLNLNYFLKNYLNRKEEYISTNKENQKKLEEYEKEKKIIEDEILNKNRILRELSLELSNPSNNENQSQHLEAEKIIESLINEKEEILLKIKNAEEELEEIKRNSQELDFFQKFEKEEENSRREEELIKFKILLNKISEEIEKKKREILEFEKNTKVVDKHFENNIILEKEKYKKRLEELVKKKIEIDKNIRNISFEDFYFNKDMLTTMVELEDKLTNFLLNPLCLDELKLTGNLEKFKRMYTNTFFEIEEVNKLIRKNNSKLVYTIKELKKDEAIEELKISINGTSLNNNVNLFKVKEKIIYLENKLKKDEMKNSYFSNKAKNLQTMFEQFFTVFLQKDQLKEMVKKEIEKCVKENLDENLYGLYQDLLKENV